MPTWFTDDPDFVPPPSETRAVLTVLSETLDADELVGLVGMAPDRRWERGAKADPAGRYSGIQIRARLPDDAEPSAILSDLLERLEPITRNVTALVLDERVRVQIGLAHHIENWNPGFSFSADQLERLAELGAGLELDIYTYPGPADPPESWPPHETRR